jgi:hypothetical protein
MDEIFAELVRSAECDASCFHEDDEPDEESFRRCDEAVRWLKEGLIPVYESVWWSAWYAGRGKDCA